MKIRPWFGLFLAALLGSALTMGLVLLTGIGSKEIHLQNSQAPIVQTSYGANLDGKTAVVDFTAVAQKVTPTVVHIASLGTLRRQPQFDDPFRFFFEQPQQAPREEDSDSKQPLGSGSGVIISADGYIVTNNHVIDKAEELEITLADNRSFKATVVGTDPSTDLALLKIEAEGLPYAQLANSDNVQVGEWVLAVGNPFNLNSTVTAGIVSAKARNINILQNQYAIESFIQTDAAVNPGNSGGALVNLNGDLVGINTAIASPTGSYSGYSFAVPSDIVQKIVADLREYGTVQRGFLGVNIRDVDGNLAKAEKLSVNAGVFVAGFAEGSAAKKAGVEEGDVIVAVDGRRVKSAPELQELVARKRPGDEVALTVNRKGSEKTYSVKLYNREGSEELVTKERQDLEKRLGADFRDLSEAQKKDLGLKGGVEVTRLYPGKLRQYTNMREGFIITRLNEQPVRNSAELLKALEGKSGGVMLEGVYPGERGTFYYAFGL